MIAEWKFEKPMAGSPISVVHEGSAAMIVDLREGPGNHLKWYVASSYYGSFRSRSFVRERGTA